MQKKITEERVKKLLEVEEDIPDENIVNSLVTMSQKVKEVVNFLLLSIWGHLIGITVMVDGQSSYIFLYVKYKDKNEVHVFFIFSSSFLTSFNCFSLAS